MISQLLVRNFQSIRHADLDLGYFTVIVGPSSSGKSALIRAVKALASNVRGTNVITRGQKDMAITATLDNGAMITLERGERTSSYRLTGDGMHHFTKLAGEVPPMITDMLRLNPGADSVNFAGQFDKPFLLDESGAVIARELAELTNVNQIFEAVRTANRIRTGAQSTLRLRSSDLDAVTSGLKAFQELPEQLKALTHVQTLEECRQAAASRLTRLHTATTRLNSTEAAMVGYQPIEVPDASRLLDLKTRYRVLRDAAMKLVASDTAARNAAARHVDTLKELKQAQEALETFLATATICPTCGQHLHSLA